MPSFLDLLSSGCFCMGESKTVDGRKFYVKTRLGEGGFSYVDLVQDARTRKNYALKRITCHAHEDEKLAEAEIDFMRMLNHPNLIPCEAWCKRQLRAGSTSGISEYLIIMPYYRKGSVWDEIVIAKKTATPLREERVLNLLRRICDGVQALHRHTPTALTHRDIKPQNVLLCDDDTPVLMDFGSMGPATVQVNNSYQARAMTDLASERCTMTYRAPELFNVQTNCTVDEKVDIWSLGCTLYAMCFQDSPYEDTYIKGGSLALASLSGKVNIPHPPSSCNSLGCTLYAMCFQDSPYEDTYIKGGSLALASLSGKVNIPQSHSYSPVTVVLIQQMMRVEPAERPTIEQVITTCENQLTRTQNRV